MSDGAIWWQTPHNPIVRMPEWKEDSDKWESVSPDGILTSSSAAFLVA